MLDATYPPPVAALIGIGDSLEPKPPAQPETMPSLEEMMVEVQARQDSKDEPLPFQSANWPDYRQFGLGLEHVPALLAMVADDTLLHADVDDPESWAPIHAWRALGQLGAEAAIDPLIALIEKWDDWDFYTEEVPEVFGLIGPAALPALAAFLDKPIDSPFARGTAAWGIAKVGRMHPETRETAVRTLMDHLRAYRDNGLEFNTALIGPLLDLEAVEAVPLLREVYAAEEAVDESWYGDIEDVEIAFGVRTERDTSRPRYNPFAHMPGPPPADALWDQVVNEEVKAIRRPSEKQKAKAKRKMAEKSRRKNRKRK